MKHSVGLDLPVLSKLDRETASQHVYRCLRHAVMIGRIPPGRALTIREIADTLSVSMMPVREALRLLAAERALEVRDNRRVQVPNMTAVRFRELCELRVVLETHAALGAMPYVTSECIEKLEELDDRIDIDDAVRRENFEQAIMFNQEFHRYLYLANPYQESLPLIESVWLQMGPFLRLALAKLKTFYPIDRHVEAVAALRRRDPIGLKLAIEADIRDGVMHVGSADLLGAYTDELKAPRICAPG